MAVALPYVDEHVVDIPAPREDVWAAVVGQWSTDGRDRPRLEVARILGCRPLHPSAGDLRLGSTLPGFRVSRFDAPAVLGLEGEHRFSRYALVITLESAGTGTRVAAETRAAFPGLAGRAYRALVIDSGLHVMAMRRLLGSLRRAALARAG
ncbi:MAG TPA: hypothetical protein VD931_20315 [Baekduia sp.]|nr:hypothetical protein [Baekduia sp.]